MKRLLAVLGVGLSLLAACSQAAALAPVGGNRLALIRFAANDVLVTAKIDILAAPVCTMTGRDVACTGSTLDGEPITVTSTAADQAVMEIVVGTRSVYRGSIQDVLDANARPTS